MAEEKDVKKAEKKNAWLSYSEEVKKDVFQLNDGYKKYISDCKTERECVTEAVRQAKEQGYVDLNEVIANNGTLKAGDKVYFNNMGKALALFLIGSEPLEKGMKILGAHVDSPRIDLKQVPCYEDTDMALLDTHYYGGIKKYQWVTLPLALHGVVVKKDGTVIDVCIGEDVDDPVVGITDLLVHLSGKQMGKKASEVIEGEDLNILVGSMPLDGEEKDAVKANVLKLLKEKYDFEEEDFLSAEIEVVPAGPARDYGLDRSMVAGYGHDDRCCAFTSLYALIDVDEVEHTACCILVDKEEVGSIGATGAQSKFFENVIAELLEKTNEKCCKLRTALENSKMLSSDVSAGVDPLFLYVNESKNSAYLGNGLCINKYTGSRGKGGCNDASPEFIAWLRKVFDEGNVNFQTAEIGKVDQGGGGTIAYILGNLNMDVIDAGIPVLNMHAPMEIVSKVDLYEAYLGYKAFLKA